MQKNHDIPAASLLSWQFRPGDSGLAGQQQDQYQDPLE
jgi:hypothetical protein